MTGEENPFLLPPPPPPERATTWRVILVLSTVAHLAAFAYLARRPVESPPAPQSRETVRVLRGEVSETGEPGLRLFGYADVPAPGEANRLR